jgi:hypothetical protein
MLEEAPYDALASIIDQNILIYQGNVEADWPGLLLRKLES